MAVTYVATATPTAVGHTTGTTTDPLVTTLPTGTASGDRVIIVQAANNTSATAPTGWTVVAQDVQVGPTGTAPGAGTGRRYLSFYYRDYDGVWTMPTLNLTGATQNTHAATVITLRKSVFDTWNTPTVSSAGQFTAVTTAYSVTVPSFTTTSGGLLIVGAATNDNVTASAQTLTQTGATLANLAERADTGSATGNDVSIKAYTADVTTGATNTITHAATLSLASEGGSVVVQQTVTSSPPTGLVGYATATAGGGTVTVTKAAVDASLGGTVTNADDLIAIHSADTGVLTDMTAATGTWTLLASLDGNAAGAAAKVKIWFRPASSEPTSWAFGQNSGSDGVVTIIALRGMDVDPTHVVDAITSTAAGTSRVTPDVDHAGTASSIMLAGAAVAANNTACSFTNPGDMTELVDSQSNTWVTHAVAFLSGPSDPTGTKTFTASTATQQGPGVQWAMVIPPTASGPTAAETGRGTLGLAATSTPVKVAKLGGTSALGLAATAVARKVDPSGGTSAIGLAGTGTARKVAQARGTSALGLVATRAGAASRAVLGVCSVGLAGTGTARKTAQPTGRALLGLAGTGTARKLATGRGITALGSVGTALPRKLAASRGSSGLGLIGRVSFAVAAGGLYPGGYPGSYPRSVSADVRAIIGRCTLGFAGAATDKKVTAANGAVTVGLTATATDKKVTAANGAVTVGLTATATDKKVTAANGAVTVGLVTTGRAGKRAPQAGLTALALVGTGYISVWGPPANLTATPVSTTRIDLLWIAVVGASGYDLERNGVVIATDVTGTGYSDTGLTAGTTYTYRARSVHA